MASYCPGMPASPLVCVVIPSFRGGLELIAALSSVHESDYCHIKIIIVDNASCDGTKERAKALFPGIMMIINDRNYGFAAACNQGIKLAIEANSDFVLLLNQDARLCPGALSLMVELAQSRPESAAVGCRTHSSAKLADGTSCLLYDGSWRYILPSLQKIPGIGSNSNDGGQPKEVDYIWGHCMLIRCSALKEVGLFDTSFFMYYEDLDLCLRLSSAGWKLYCDSRASAVHNIDDPERAVKSDLSRWRMKARSHSYFYRKRMNPFLADTLWILASCIEAYWLLKKLHFKALYHLLRSTADELGSDRASLKSDG